MSTFTPIDIIALDHHTALINHYPLPEIVHLEDPALAVLIDFHHHTPITVHPATSINDALEEMKLLGVHELIVCEGDTIRGLITTDDLLGEKPIQIIQSERVPRDELTVQRLMTPTENMIAFDRNTIMHFQVGHIMSTLKTHGVDYALVTSTNSDQSQLAICGLFSTWQIGRQLHRSINEKIQNAKTLSELNKRHSK